MTDFDTPLDPTPEPEPEAPTPTPEEIAKTYLKEQGIDPDAIDFKKVANLTNWERDLNKKSSDLGAMAKAIEKQPSQAATTEPDFDPNELTTLEAAMKKVLGIDPKAIAQTFTATQQALEAERAEVAESFFSDHADIPSEQLIKELYEDGVNLDTIPPAQLKRKLDKAYRVIKANAFDPADIEAKAKELAEKMVAEMTKDGQVIDIKKGRASGGGHKTIGDVMDDPSATFFDKMDAFSSLKTD